MPRSKPPSGPDRAAGPEAEWKILRKERLPGSVRYYAKKGPRGYVSARAAYMVYEERQGADGKPEVRTRIEPTPTVYALEHPDLDLAFKVADLALGKLEDRCFALKDPAPKK